MMTIVAIVFLLTPHIQQVLAKQKVETSLATNDFSTIKDYLSFVLSPSHPIENMFGRDFAVIFNPDILESNQNSNLFPLVDALNFANQKNYIAAFRLLDGMNQTQYPVVINNIRNALQILSQTSLEVGTVQDSLASKKKQLKSVNEAGNFIAEDFADFLSLKAVVNKSTDSPHPIYTTGILQGLPQLENLKDNIVDLIELRDLLTKLGGEVKTPKHNQHMIFKQMLSKISQQINDNAEEFNRIQLELDDLVVRKKILSKMRKRQKEIMSINLANVIKLELNTALSPLSFYLEPFITQATHNLLILRGLFVSNFFS